MLISFREFQQISEGKQVGVIYHFTRLSSLISIIESKFIINSHSDYFSFTRNYNMVDFKKYKNDFSIDWEKFGDKRLVRIVVDGDKLSNNFKVLPFLDKNIKRVQGEWEEVIKKDNKEFNILPYIVQIDIFQDVERFDKTIEYIKSINSSLVKLIKKVDLSKGFTKYKG